MKIRVDFTMEIPADDLDALKELAGDVGSLTEARRFVQAEAEENILSYLEDNGVMPRSLRGTARPDDHSARDNGSNPAGGTS